MFIKKSSFAILVSLICSVLIVVGCSQKTGWQEELKTAAAEDKYTLLFITDGKSAACKAVQASLQESTRNSQGQFKIIEANAGKEQYALIKLLKLKDLNKIPLTLVIAPNGAITGSFAGQATPDALQGYLVSRKEADILRSMQKNEIVLLCLHKGETRELEGAKSELQAIGTNYAGKVSVYYVDAADRQNAAIVGKLPPITTKLAVLAIAPSGSIAATLEGSRINRQNLLKAAQSCSSGCGSGCK